MPKIPSQTASALETKELATPAFRVGRHQERTIDLSPCQERVMDILSFRGKTAARLQETEGRVPSELDQGAAEVAKLLKEGKNLNDLSPQQIAQAYFILRETQGNKAYKDWVVEGLPAGKHKDRVWRRESKLLEQTIGDFERRLVGRRYGKTIESIIRAITGKPSAREILVLEGLINNHRSKGASEEQAIERATADYSAQEIVKVLGQRGGEISQERIDAARESTNPTDKKFAQAAERIPELAEIGMKKRREIAAWTKADELRKFIGKGIVEADLANEELILRLMENNPDLLPVTAYKNYQNLKKGLAEKTPAQLKQLADRATRALVSEHSFNTVVDTAVYIIDRKLPEVEEVEERVVAAKPELTTEAARRVGEPEIVLMISEGLSDQEMSDKGVDPEVIKAVGQKYFYKDTAGQYKLKQPQTDNLVKTEKENRLKDVQLRHQTELNREIDGLTEEKAKSDLLGLERSEDYETEMMAVASKILRDRKRKKPRFKNLQALETYGKLDICRSQWVRNKTREYMRNEDWRKEPSTIGKAWQSLVVKKPVIGEEYNYMVTKITPLELAQLGPEVLALLRDRGDLDSGSYAGVELALGRDNRSEIIDDQGRLKSKKEISQELAKKRIKTIFWVLLILLNIVDLESAIASLQSEGKTTEADEVTNLLTGT